MVEQWLTKMLQDVKVAKMFQAGHQCLPFPCPSIGDLAALFPLPRECSLFPAYACAASRHPSWTALGWLEHDVTNLMQLVGAASRARAKPPKASCGPLGSVHVGGGPEPPYRIRCLSLRPGPKDKLRAVGQRDRSSYYFPPVWIRVVESSVPFNPHVSVYFQAGSAGQAFPITSRGPWTILTLPPHPKHVRAVCFFSTFKRF